jgi:hypothetical protein
MLPQCDFIQKRKKILYCTVENAEANIKRMAYRIRTSLKRIYGKYNLSINYCIGNTEKKKFCPVTTSEKLTVLNSVGHR